MAEAERYTIDTVRTDHIAQMHTLYLEQTKSIPHCRLQPDPVYFQNDYLTPGWQSNRISNPPKAIQSFVAEDGGRSLVLPLWPPINMAPIQNDRRSRASFLPMRQPDAR